VSFFPSPDFNKNRKQSTPKKMGANKNVVFVKKIKKKATTYSIVKTFSTLFDHKM
jgi:acid phosphatase class B